MFHITAFPSKNELKSDFLILFLNESSCKKHKKPSEHIPGTLFSKIQKYLRLKDFKGTYKETLLVYPDDGSQVRRILLIGTGKPGEITPDRLRTLGFVSSEWAEKFGLRRIHIFTGAAISCKESTIKALAEGIVYQRYTFKQYKTDKDKKQKQVVYTFICGDKDNRTTLRDVLRETNIQMEALRIVRDLANHPSNVCTPGELKSFAESHFGQVQNVTVTVIDAKGLKQRKLNALLGVAKGSKEKPYLIIIHYKPPVATKKCLALVGKGVTFDSGGISLKPAEKMDEMKYDMAGAAVVYGVLHAVSELKPGFEVVGIVPAVENMPGNNALKPGDILTAFNGKTIEILNTDAEGRLILADAIAYAEATYKPGVIIDLATLTGSCVVALGDKAAGLFTADKALSDLLVESGEESGDRVWPLPIWDSYSEDIKSEIADIKNIGSRWAGSITAAKFLERFVLKSKWAHIDIAGTSYDVKNIGYLSRGATGFGLRLLINACKKLEKIL